MHGTRHAPTLYLKVNQNVHDFSHWDSESKYIYHKIKFAVKRSVIVIISEICFVFDLLNSGFTVLEKVATF